MRKGYRKLEEMSTADLGFSLDEVRGRSLGELARMGGKLLLEVAMREEVAECLGRDRYERALDAPTCLPVGKPATATGGAAERCRWGPARSRWTSRR